MVFKLFLNTLQEPVHDKIFGLTGQFKTILALEKQLSETDAILSSYKENVNALDQMKKDISNLERTLEEKDTAIKSLQEKASQQQESAAEGHQDKSYADLNKENIELKETLKFTENELKRTTDEKKHALDELLKQTASSMNKGKSQRKRVPSNESVFKCSRFFIVDLLLLLTNFYKWG